MTEPYDEDLPDAEAGDEEYDEEYEEDAEYEDFDAPQVGDSIPISTEDNDAWDDTALIEAWDEAVKEYQTYHSAPAPDDPPFSNKSSKSESTHRKRVAPPKTAKDMNGSSANKKARRVKTPATKPAPRQEDYTAPEEAQQQEEHQTDWNQNYWAYQSYQDNAGSSIPPPPPPNPPQASAAAGEDEALSNLMMAWYYSGYYTGYYQAMRRR
ncbi:hypothetical protein INT43_003284 [Umbelopsis isabellina]|uniref:Survival Motor Neuron Gemin2-binding domain-containing protein n=1 Tax=Mortierella isabellina TaxID=91625 RepID=A0A8H7PQ53_MORIS|nr:hypothetical protein INT43_003284 [Umbelopsis isabellina]